MSPWTPSAVLVPSVSLRPLPSLRPSPTRVSNSNIVIFRSLLTITVAAIIVMGDPSLVKGQSFTVGSSDGSGVSLPHHQLVGYLLTSFLGSRPPEP